MSPERTAPGPALHVVACAHGTDNPDGRRLVDGLRDDLSGALREAGIHAVVHEAYVDVQQPALPDVLAALPAGDRAVVAPLLLSEGFHTGVDIAEAVAGRAGTTAAAPIGADPRVAEVLAERLFASGFAPGDAVVLAAAGTRIEAGQQQARRVADLLAERLGQPVTPAFCSAASPSVAAAVADARASGAARVGVASHLLAPGFFHDRLSTVGADYVSDPLLPSVTIASCVAGRLAESDFGGSAAFQ